MRYRGAWVAVDPRELAEIQKRLASGAGDADGARQALVAALAGEARHDGMSVAVVGRGDVRRAARAPA